MDKTQAGFNQTQRISELETIMESLHLQMKNNPDKELAQADKVRYNRYQSEYKSITGRIYVLEIFRSKDNWGEI